jgi:DNA-directed RNA polymerase specialized sigma24 family protein
VEAINELTPEHRAVILLREVDGLSYEEISQVLDCPKGTVMSRLHYARRQLQARSGACADGHDDDLRRRRQRASTASSTES